MAMRYIPPVRRKGSGQVLTGIATGISGAAKGLTDYWKTKEKESLVRETQAYQMLDNMDIVSSISEKRMAKANQAIADFEQHITGAANGKSRWNILMNGRFTPDDMLSIINHKNRVELEIQKLNKDDEFVLNIAKQYNDPKNKGKFREDAYQRGMNMYINTDTPIEQIEFLRESPVDLSVLASQAAPPQKQQATEKEEKIGNKMFKIFSFADDNERIGWLTNQFASQGAQDWALGVFFGEIPGPYTPTEEEKLRYIHEAELAARGGKTLFGNPQTHAAYLWAVEKIAPLYLQDVVKEEIQEPEESKEKTVISPVGDIWSMYDKPIKLTGYEGARATNVVELLYGKPREDLEEGLYFKVYRTSPQGEKQLNQAQGSKDAMEKLAELLNPEDYETDYIPYNKIAGMVEKTYQFKGIEGYKGRKKATIESLRKKYNY